MRQTWIDGVLVEWAGSGSPEQRPPLLFVHGGLHGSWCWANMMGWFATRGWQCAALNWYAHNGSGPVPGGNQVTRSITDVRTEIGAVADQLARPPVLVGHSMGGLATLAYAARHEVDALVLLTPVVPKEFGQAPVELPVDLAELWGPPPPDVARHFFWSGVGDGEAAQYYQRLCPESPAAVWEATRWTADVDLSGVRAPCYVVAAEHDPLVPAVYVEALASALGAEQVTLPGRGHGIPLDPGWEEVAADVEDWLRRRPGEAIADRGAAGPSR